MQMSSVNGPKETNTSVRKKVSSPGNDWQKALRSTWFENVSNRSGVVAGFADWERGRSLNISRFWKILCKNEQIRSVFREGYGSNANCPKLDIYYLFNIPST